MELYVSLPSSQFSKLIYNFKGKWEKEGKISWKDILAFLPFFRGDCLIEFENQLNDDIMIITVFHYKWYVWICYDDI